MKVWVCLFFMTLSISCSGGSDHHNGGNDPEDSAKVTGAFLTKGDLTAGSGLQKLSSNEISDFMSADQPFYHQSYFGSDALNVVTGMGLGVDRCITDELSMLRLQASTDRAVITESLSLSACLDLIDEPNLEIIDQKMTARLFFAVVCKGTDLEYLDGVSLAELVRMGTHPCQGAERAMVRYQFDSRSLFKAKFVLHGRKVLFESGLRLIHAGSGGDKEYCELEPDAGLLLHQDCRTIRRSLVTDSRTTVNGKTTTDEAQGQEYFTQIEHLATQAAPGQGWPGVGRLRLRKNNWEGEVIFQTDGSEPRWIMSSGERTEAGVVLAEPGDDDDDDNPGDDDDDDDNPGDDDDDDDNPVDDDDDDADNPGDDDDDDDNSGTDDGEGSE